MEKEKKFLVDFMLGRLARWLRILGFDAAYYKDKEREGIIYRSLKEKRAVITRDASLSSRKALALFRVKSDNYLHQLKEVLKEFELEINPDRIFSRCSECNLITEPVKKEKIRKKVPGYVFENHNAFSSCSGCGKIYWMGTHKNLMEKVLLKAGIKWKLPQ